MLYCGRASYQECKIERPIMAEDPAEKMGDDAELRAPDSWESWQPGPLQLQRNDPSWFDDENGEILLRAAATPLEIIGRSEFGRVRVPDDGLVIANGNCSAEHAAPNFIDRSNSNAINNFSSGSYASDHNDFDLRNQLVHPGDGSISSEHAPAFYCGGREEDGDEDDGACSTSAITPSIASPKTYHPGLLNDVNSTAISPSIYAPGCTPSNTTDSSSNPSPVPAFIDKFSSPIHSWFSGKSLSTCSCNGMRFRSSCSVGSGRAGSPSRRRNRIRDVCCCISVTGRRRGRSLSGVGGKWSSVGEQWDHDDEGDCCGERPSVTTSKSSGGRSARRRMWRLPRTLCLFALGISFGLTVMLFLHTTMRYGSFNKTDFKRTSLSSQFSENEPKKYFPNSGEDGIVNYDSANLDQHFAEQSKISNSPGCGYNSLRATLAVLFGGTGWRSVFTVDSAAVKELSNSGRTAPDSDIFTSLPKSVTGDESGNPSDDDDGLMVMKQGGEWGESEELGGNVLPPNKQLVLVGVMTAGQYLHSRAAAIAATWASSIPGKVIFFVGEENQERGKDPQMGVGNSEDVGQDGASAIPDFLPGSKHGITFEVVKLEGVNDRTYPPQKKSFLMLKYMADHYGDQFEWFMRADDDVFVRGERLALMLRSINSSRPLFLGQTGLGNKEEYGQLSLGDRGNYCMGGTGMILSQATLAAIHGRIRECLHGLYTGHEDVEVGRCIRRFAGVSCTWAYEMQSIFYNNQNGSRLYAAELNVPAVEQAVTLHPLKQPELLHRLHAHFVRRRLDDGNFRLLQLRRHLGVVGLALASGGLLDHVGLGPRNMDMNVEPSLLKYRPLSPSDVQSWEFLSPTLVYCAGGVMCPRHALGTSQRRAFQDVVKQILYLMNRHARQRGRVLEFTEMLYGYRRVDPLHGVDYIMDLLLMYKKFKGKRVTVPVRRHAYLQQSFADMEFIEVPRAAEADSATNVAPQSLGGPVFAPPVQTSPADEAVHIILPLSGRFSTFQRFLSHFEHTCLSPTLDTEDRVTAEDNAELVDGYSRKTPNSAHLCGSVSILVVYFDAPVGVASNLNDPGNDNRPQEPVDNHDDQRSRRSFLRIFDNLKLPQTIISDPQEQILPDFEQIKRLLNELINRYPGKVLDYKAIKADGEFSRGRAMMEGARWSAPDALLFLTDVDILFTAEAIYRIRQNVQRGRMVYFPMVFSEYDPGFVQQFGSRQLVEQFRDSDPVSANFKDFGSQHQGLQKTAPPGYFALQDAPSVQHTETAESKETTAPQWPDHFSSLDDDHGYFRHFGFGIAAMYRSDLFAVGGYNLSIRGWGLEDVDLFERCIKSPVNNLTLFRAPDPGLIHVYHAVKCDPEAFPSAAQYRMCLGSKAASFASKEVLANAVMSLLDGGTGRLKNL